MKSNMYAHKDLLKLQPGGVDDGTGNDGNGNDGGQGNDGGDTKL